MPNNTIAGRLFDVFRKKNCVIDGKSKTTHFVLSLRTTDGFHLVTRCSPKKPSTSFGIFVRLNISWLGVLALPPNTWKVYGILILLHVVLPLSCCSQQSQRGISQLMQTEFKCYQLVGKCRTCLSVQASIAQTGAALIRQCWQQEVGCVFSALSQEVADCITGGTDGGRAGRDGLGDCWESMGGK